MDTTTLAVGSESSTSQVGDIWYTSWGYDQTNVEFFQVVRETKGSLVLRRIAARVSEGRLFPRAGEFVTDCHLMGNSTEYDRASGEWVPAAVYERDKARGYSEKLCRKPRVSKDGYVFAPVRIDDVRSAWPYESGGKYETYAAGQMGH